VNYLQLYFIQSVKAEEMNLDSSLDAMIKRVNDIKASINQFLWKLDHEHETLNWPSVLDSFALLSSQLCTLQKLLTNEKTAQLKNYVFVPLHLQPDRDMELEVCDVFRITKMTTLPYYKLIVMATQWPSCFDTQVTPHSIELN